MGGAFHCRMFDGGRVVVFNSKWMALPRRIVLAVVALSTLSTVAHGQAPRCQVLFSKGGASSVAEPVVRAPRELLVDVVSRIANENRVDIEPDTRPRRGELGALLMSAVKKFGIDLQQREKWYPDFPTLPLFYYLRKAEADRILVDVAYRKDLATFLLAKYKEEERKDQEVRYFERAFTNKILGIGRYFKDPTVQSLDRALMDSARLVAAVQYAGRLDPRAPALSYATFARLAKIENLRVLQHSDTYRFDTRPPLEIQSSGGFAPNPGKAIGPISLHAVRNSQGGRFVSLSEIAGNAHSLRSAVASSLREPVARETVPSSVLQEMTNFTATHSLEPTADLAPKLYVIYEYRVGDVWGVIPKAEHSLPGEREIIAPFVAIENVREVRSVYVLKGTEISENPFKKTVIQEFYGPWTSL